MPPEENEMGQEKTEAPTGKRRQKAREKGSVARSKEINSAVLLFFALCTFALYGPLLVRQMTEQIRYAFIHFTEFDFSDSSFYSYAVSNIWFILKLVFPVFAVFIFIGIVVNIAQFGWLFSTQTIFQGMKGFSLNPTKIIKKMFDLNSFVQLLLSVVKLLILCTVAYHTLKVEMPKFPTLISLSIDESLRFISIMLFQLSLKIIALLLILAAIDFIWEKYKHEKSLKMTKVEIKEEMKQVEGDPKIKAQIRGAQRKMLISTMIRNVPEADVVITNPFHIAVAVKYNAKEMAAPRVVAKGARLIAERIKDSAREHDVPIVENKPLARTIYKTIDVGQEVPPKLYQAVAEVLAYVYQLDKRRGKNFAL